MPINSLAPFIDRGWWTAPLSSSHIKREGKDKSFVAPKNWNQYKDSFNTAPTLVGAVMTGVKSGVSVLDCDTTHITELLLPLLPVGYGGITKSIGKVDKYGSPIEAMSVFFRYMDSYPATLNQGPMGLEWFNGGAARMVFLPTENNLTKEPWESVPELIECPEAILALIQTFSQPTRKTRQNTMQTYEAQHTTNLNPMLVQELKNRSLSHSLFTIITPKAFKHIDSCLTPPHIPEGQRSNYVSKVSAIIGSDTSVDKSLYTEFILYINALCPNPITVEQLNREIITPMVSETSQINGQTIWKYDKHWEKARLNVVSKMGHALEYFYDSLTRDMYEINHSRGLVGTFGPKDITGIVASMAIKALPHQQYKFMNGLPHFEASLQPQRAFGVVGNHEYNLFKPTTALQSLTDPQHYIATEVSELAAGKYEEFLQSLVPNEDDRTYLVNHLYTKLTTFNYSAVVYYFVGTPGSGKGTFVRLLSELIGASYISQNLGENEIKEKYNEWLHNRYFVHFDELHRSLNPTELKAANEKIKRLTGGKTFALRKMRTDSDPDVPMLATFIFTQNGNAMRFDEKDRRYMWMDTPNKLSEELSEFWDELTPEKIAGVAKYLREFGQTLSHAEYKEPPFSEAKQRQIVDKMPTAYKIFYFLHRQEFGELYQLALECGISMELFMEGALKKRIYEDLLTQIVSAKHPTFSNIEAALTREAKAQLPTQPPHPYTTVKGGGNRKFYICEGLDDWFPPLTEGDEDDSTE